MEKFLTAEIVLECRYTFRGYSLDVKDESAEIYHDVLYYIINYSYKLNTEQCIKPYKYSVNYFFLHLMIITCKGILNLLFPVPTNSTTDKLNAQEVISAVAWDHGKCYLCWWKTDQCILPLNFSKKAAWSVPLSFKLWGCTPPLVSVLHWKGSKVKLAIIYIVKPPVRLWK